MCRGGNGMRMSVYQCAVQGVGVHTSYDMMLSRAIGNAPLLCVSMWWWCTVVDVQCCRPMGCMGLGYEGVDECISVCGAWYV